MERRQEIGRNINYLDVVTNFLPSFHHGSFIPYVISVKNTLGELQVPEKKNLLANLTKEEIQMLVDTEYEAVHAGKWERIYPTVERLETLGKYLPERPLNKLLEQWIQLSNKLQL